MPQAWCDFFINFFANLGSDILVAWFLLTKLPQILQRRQEPDCTVRASITGDSGEYVPVTFELVNVGVRALNRDEAEWHIYIDQEEKPTSAHLTSIKERVVKLGDRTYIEYPSVLDKPAFHNSPAGLMGIEIPKKRSHAMYYFLSTTYGSFPRDVKLDQFGQPLTATMGKIEVVNPWDVK